MQMREVQSLAFGDVPNGGKLLGKFSFAWIYLRTTALGWFEKSIVTL